MTIIPHDPKQGIYPTGPEYVHATEGVAASPPVIVTLFLKVTGLSRSKCLLPETET